MHLQLCFGSESLGMSQQDFTLKILYLKSFFCLFLCKLEHQNQLSYRERHLSQCKTWLIWWWKYLKWIFQDAGYRLRLSRGRESCFFVWIISVITAQWQFPQNRTLGSAHSCGLDFSCRGQLLCVSASASEDLKRRWNVHLKESCVWKRASVCLDDETWIVLKGNR